MSAFVRRPRALDDRGLLSLGDQLVTYQCHHHGLFLDQTVSDALAGEGWAVRRQAAFESAHALLDSFYGELEMTGADERLALAAELFASMGQGALSFALSAEGGLVQAKDLHYGASFAEKYAGRIKNRRPVDTFAAGFVSAAASLAFPSDWGALEAEETSCIARDRWEDCTFALARRPEPPHFGVVVSRPLVEQIPRADDEPLPSDTALRAGAALTHLLPRALAREEGATPLFGPRLALVPASYIDQITFDTVHLIEKRAPELFPIVAALVREAAQSGAFHLLGGILASAPFREEHGPPARDEGERLEQLIGLMPALGWGTFSIAEHQPGRALVLQSFATHESVHHAIRHGDTVRSRLFFQQGVALALMQLLHRVDFTSAVPITPGSYDALFRSGTRFHVQETLSPLKGDRVAEVMVEALPDR
ncbi:MAG: hypothetical protein ABI193_03665 [Minicystis sp.]